MALTFEEVTFQCWLTAKIGIYPFIKDFIEKYFTIEAIIMPKNAPIVCPE